MRILILLTVCLNYARAYLWPEGIVHYAINKKDYDIHSQDIITETLSRLQLELCLKFFNTPGNFSATHEQKILYISNPSKLKDCAPQQHRFDGKVVDMAIGYRCLDPKNISRIVVNMLRTSIGETESPVNSNDLLQRFQEREDALPRTTLLNPADRGFLHVHYQKECRTAVMPNARRSSPDSSTLTDENWEFYRKLLWPLGVVMYGVHPDISPDDPTLKRLLQAMSHIARHSCVVFQPLPDDQLQANNFLWFAQDGEDLPELGFRHGNQTLKLSSMVNGAPGHRAHALHAVLRALGIPMMSNRYDRDSYVAVHWDKVQQGKEHYLERTPAAAWVKHIPYDMKSASHAPANYMCRECDQPLTAITVLPLQDTLWQRTLTMGRTAALSESDKELLKILYAKECNSRNLRINT